MSTVLHTSTAVTARIDTQRLDLRIHSDGERFKFTHKDSSGSWRQLANLLGPGQPVKESVPLDAVDALAAEMELRKLLAGLSGVEVEESTYFRYTKGNERFTIEVKPQADITLTMKSAAKESDTYRTRLNSFIIALGLSPLCRSVELVNNTIFIGLAPRYSTDKQRLATYEALIDLYK